MDELLDDGETYDGRREELIERTKQQRQQDEQEHQALLDAVEAGEEFEVENYEWVELGSAELRVKAWFPGDVTDKIAAFGEAVDDPSAARQGIQATLDALVEMTECIQTSEIKVVSEGKIRNFYRRFYDKWGVSGLERAVDTVVSPAEEGMQSRQDVVQGFRGEGRR